MTTPFSYEDALAAIWKRSGYDRGFISNPFAGDDAARSGLLRTAGVLERLGNPERDYRIVHIAGSKGKGSTTVTVDALLRAAGHRTGRFISPHLHSYRERIVVQDRPISEEDFAALTADALAATEALEHDAPELGDVTAWELSTAMALCWYARAGCEIAVIEVGMGGTLDATNVVDPEIAIITRLDYEHSAVLGDTLTEIAGNKAGIIKPGKPVVTTDQPAEALAVIEARARETGSRLILAGRDFTVTGTDLDFTFTSGSESISGLHTALAGRHQVENTALAIAAVRTITDISADQIRQGLAAVVHPGRFEEVRIDAGRTVVIDGAHSPVAARALVRALQDRYPGQQAAFVIGMLQDKDVSSFTATLEPLAAHWYLAPPASPRALATETLIPILAGSSTPVDSAPSVADSLAAAMAAPHPLIVVTGSLTTVADARVALGLARNDPAPGTSPRVSYPAG
ncbi:MAG TPA: folylpolyglutamate synthase/dihydrofolate synthase family protein [Thermomicrobiales bacterium]|nr:folylpolyglutamate synthase/dihydrofolate synthase family protein [Thermomicrobiales bacterium]